MKHLFISILLLLSLSSFTQEQDKEKCTATTHSGVRCKNSAQTSSQFCHIHNPNSPRCGEPTSKKTPCKRTVKTQGMKCTQHSQIKQ